MRIRRTGKTLTFVLAVIVVMTVGCETTGSKKDAGTVIGAVTGAVVGSQIGSGTGSVIAAIAGAAAGAWLGRQLGSYLDEEDQERLANSTHEAAESGATVSWRNSETGVSGKSEVTESVTKQETVKISVAKERIEQVPPLELIGGPHQSGKSVNVRGGPGTDYVVVDQLAPGEQVNVIGQVKGQNWYLISEGGVGTGFVYTGLLQPVPTPQIVETPTDSNTLQTAEAKVEVQSTCRTVLQTVVLADGSEKQDEVTACRGPEGWKIT